jgi:hypothetical protein
MATDIPDLWGPEIKLDVLTPTMILNAQAEKLKEKTKGVILADFFARMRGNIKTLVFDIRAPAVANFRVRIMTVRHHSDRIYPAVVTSRSLHRGDRSIPDEILIQIPENESYNSFPCFTSNEFVNVVAQVLRSVDVQSVIESLIAKSNEAMTPGAYVPVENLDEKIQDNEETPG